MQEIVSYLIEKNISIASVESFTVGAFANKIGSIPGVSKIYRGSMVTYQTQIKQKLLQIDQHKINQFGVVSEEIAYDMAKNGSAIFDCDLCVSFTGNSGPLPMEDKPVGLCYMGVSFTGNVSVFTLHLNGNREEIKTQAIKEACCIIKEKILKIGESYNGY